jgi:protein-disulfide isomerase
MLNTKKLLTVFVPAIALVAFALFIRVLQYEPLFPKEENNPADTNGQFVIPIFPNDPILGDKKAPTTIIAFEDFSCPSCKQQSALLDTLLETYPGKFKIIWKGLPVSEYPYSSKLAHTYGYCAHAQEKFNEFRQLAFANSDNLSESILQKISESLDINTNKFSECLSSTNPQSYFANVEGVATILNIQSVPTFFIDNKQITTPKTETDWETILGLTQ